jgi:hypothetical protein
MRLAAGIDVMSVEQLADALIAASGQQSETKEIEDLDEQVDFVMACDAFNLWRMQWRLRVEFGEAEKFIVGLREVICERRQYDPEEFGLAVEATAGRARFPFGLDPLQYAYLLAQKKPVTVLKPEVQDKLSQQIFGIAVHLQQINGTKAVLLPIEQLRTVLKCRKLVAAGAVKRLMANNLLVEVGQKAHTGKAREFRVIAKEGTDFVFQNGDRAEQKPHL